MGAPARFALVALVAITVAFVVQGQRVQAAGTASVPVEAAAATTVLKVIGKGGRSQPLQVPLEISKLELAQAHVLPPGGRSWTLSGNTRTYTLVGKREALAIVTLSPADARNPVIEAVAGGQTLGAVPLSPPSAFPPTEAGGPRYSSDSYSAMLPADWMVPGVQLRARSDQYARGAAHSPVITADSHMALRILPFYLYGATPANSVPLSVTATPPADVATELYAKWPMAALVVQNHPAVAAVWSELVFGPGNGTRAYIVRNSDEQRDGFASMGMLHHITGQIRGANGDGSAASQYYVPLVMRNAQGAHHSTGGSGLGGSAVGVGDYSYTWVFEHEQGHAFGLPHVGDAYDEGSYPYAKGSLLGSNWGFDSLRREFQAPFMPTTSIHYANCKLGDHPRQLDAQGRCVKQDPMQGGQADGAADYRFSIFSDYSVAVIQDWMEGDTVRNQDGTHRYGGGAILHDPAFPSQYKRWDGIDLRWVNVNPETTDLGLFGLRQGIPLVRNVPVHTIAIAFSRTDPATSRIYPPLSYAGGNLLEYIDPTDATQRASIALGTGKYQWYCQNGGCDYTVRVTYTNGSVRHVLLQGAYRPWFGADKPVEPGADDPFNHNSFRVWVVNVPGSLALRKIELIETPMAWQGFPANPVVRVSSTITGTASAAQVQVTAQAQNRGRCAELRTVAVPATAMPESRCGRRGSAR